MDPPHEPSPRRIFGRKIHLKPRNTNLLFFIPARGGSKGIPGKNLIPLAGLPLIAAGFIAAAASGFFCIKLLLGFLQKHTAKAFVFYRWALAALVVIVALARV